MKVLSTENSMVLAEQNGWSLAFAQGYVDGKTSRRLGKTPALHAVVGIDERSMGFRAGYFERASRSQVSDIAIPQLVSQVYDSAPAAARRQLLGHLLGRLRQPLGLLSLCAVANGVFAKIWFHKGWQNLQIEDTEIVRASDVAVLVDYLEQVSVETVDGLAQMVAASPVMAGSAAAAVLVAALVQRARSRRAGAGKADDLSLSAP